MSTPQESVVTRRQVNNIATVAIVYREVNPGEIFLDRKYQHPVKLFDNQPCWWGGNWVGPSAANDIFLVNTLKREIGEELQFTLKKNEEEARRDGKEKELNLLGLPTAVYTVPPAHWTPTPADYTGLKKFSQFVQNNLKPFQMYVSTTPEALFKEADPEWMGGTLTCLIAYYTVGLPEDMFHLAVSLYHRFGNFSNESQILYTNVDEIKSKKDRFLTGHDRAYHDVLVSLGLNEAANKLPLVQGVTMEPLGWPPETYDEVEKRFLITKKPQIIK